MDNAKKKNHIPRQPKPIKKYMHPRNPYKTPPSFKKLAILYPEFRQHCTYDLSGKVHLDFKSPEALSSLTRCLLKEDFDLKVNIPSERLVPTLPLRLNYLLWIEDLLTLVYKKSYNALSTFSITGFDIGTGAACIYPLLAAQKFGWNFIGTESDEYSCKCAQENIDINGFASKIFLKKANNFFDAVEDKNITTFLKNIKEVFSKSDTSDHGSAESTGNFICNEKNDYLLDFTICNPPFFCSEEDLETKNKSKKESRSEPTGAPTGANHEKIVQGGEVSFISKMIEMSPKYKNYIRIFSSMIGNQKNVKIIKKIVQEVNPAHLSVTEFCQGRTMRWGIAWTFDSSINLERVLSKKQMCNSKPLTLLIPRTLMNQYSVQSTWKKVEAWLKLLKIKPRIVKKNNHFVSVIIKAYKETWLHQRKKKRELMKNFSQCSLKGELDCNTSSTSKRKLDPISQFEITEESNDVKKIKMSHSAKIIIDANISHSPIPNNQLDPGISSYGSSEVNCNGDEYSLKTFDKNTNTCSRNDNVASNNVNSALHVSDIKVSEKLLLSQNCDTANIPNKAKENVECLLRCSINIKQTNALISLEMSLLGGKKGKDAMNQLLLYMKNKLKCGD